MQELLYIAILPIILLLFFIYSRDKDKEPRKLLVFLFLSGIGSCILTLIATFILQSFIPFFAINMEKLNIIGIAIHSFIGIGLIEEVCKWLMVYLITYNHKEFNHVYDAIVYAVFVSLGFAAVENILYVFSYGMGIGIMRALLSVPGHACFGIFMGYYLGLAKLANINKNKTLEKKQLLCSVLVPTVLHGIFDFCLFANNWFLLIYFVFIIILYKTAIKNTKQLSNIQSGFVLPKALCKKCGNLVETKFCMICGTKNGE